MAINPGDIAFLGVNSTDPDQFAILALKPIAAGDTFYVTNGGVTGVSGAASSVFRATEGFLQYTAPTEGIAAGSVLLINAGGGSTPSVTSNSGGSAGSVMLLANSGNATTTFTFSTDGDSLTAYTINSGTHPPNLIAFIGFGDSPYSVGSTSSSNTPTISGGQVLVLANLDNAIFTNAANAYLQNIADLSTAGNFTARETTVVDLTTLSSGSISSIPTVNLSVNSNTGTEAGTTAITVTATASSAVSGNQTVSVAVTGTGITAGDYTPSNSTITIPSGQTIGSVTFTVVDDTLVEGTETATLTISNLSSGITLGSTTTQNITITDNIVSSYDYTIGGFSWDTKNIVSGGSVINATQGTFGFSSGFLGNNGTPLASKTVGAILDIRPGNSANTAVVLGEEPIVGGIVDNRAEIQLTWGGDRVANNLGYDFVIYENGFIDDPEGYAVAVRSVSTGQFTDFLYQFTNSFDDSAVNGINDGAGVFATAFNLNDFGLNAGELIDAIRIVNLIESDKVSGADGQGFLGTTGFTPLQSSGGSAISQTNLDPDITLVASLGNLQPSITKIHAPAIITSTNLPFDANPFGWLFGTSVLQNPPSPSPVVVDNQVSLNTTTGSAIQAGFFRNDQTLDRTVGYTVNFSAKILEEAREASANKNNDGLDDRAGFSVIAIGNDFNGLEIGFFSDRIWVQQDGVEPNLFTQAESVSFDTTKQATYTLTVLDNKYTLQAKEIGGTNATATLYGRLRNYSTSGATVTLNGQTVSPYAIQNFIFFGDNTTSAKASFNLSNISVSNGATAIALPSLAENSANNTVVGTIQAVDIDGNAIAYSITGGNTNGAFAINNNGQVIIANSAAIDFETNPNFNLTVQVSDGTLTDTATVAIALANVNEAPTVTSGASVSFAENGTGIVYTAMATDPDAGQTATLVYSLSGTDAALFNINSNTGAITFKNSPNFEAPTDIGANNVYDINAIASDGSLSDSKAVAITVTNINEAPIVSNAIASQPVDTDATFNFALPNNIFTDPEGDNLIYSAITPGWLSFNSTTKTFTGSAPKTVGTNAITVQVNDGNGNTTSTNFNVFVKAATVVGNVGNGTSLVDYSINTIGISIVTSDLAETIEGSSGADKIQDEGGNDSIFGNAGNDRLYGEAGDDILYGGVGTDNLWGSAGRDTFVLQAGQRPDIANDFLQGTDKLGLSGDLTFGANNTTTDVTSAPFGTATKVFAPGRVELMQLVNFTGTLTANDFTTIV